MEIWKSQKRGFPHFHRLGGYDDKNEVPNPKNRTESVKYVPGLKCKTCPRLDTALRKRASAPAGLFEILPAVASLHRGLNEIQNSKFQFLNYTHTHTHATRTANAVPSKFTASLFK